ncbi:MAG: hypothetical protein ACD_45C00473G0009 [uncultured bacterium]|nr:MAG: hypothetical protein ACD_45C00473G0009 [uncultured bacterium]
METRLEVNELEPGSLEGPFVRVPFDSSPYTPYQLNTVLYAWIKEQKGHSFNIEDVIVRHKEETQFVGFILSGNKSDEKVALFKTANFPRANNIFNYNADYSDLDEVLQSFEKHHVYCNKLIIPIAEISRNHFRLLVINVDHKTAIFYDSKSMLASKIAELGLSALDALRAPQEVKEIISIPKYFIENYNYISNICKKYFPDVQVYEYWLEHQPLNNHYDCGVFVIEYAKHAALANELTQKLQVDIEEARVEHNALFQWFKKTFTTLTLLSFRSAIKTSTYGLFSASPPAVSEEKETDLQDVPRITT